MAILNCLPRRKRVQDREQTRCSLRRPNRRGAIAVLAMMLLSVLIMLAAFGIELGMFMAEKAEMQRAADSAALAACWEYTAQRNHGTEDSLARTYARSVAASVAGDNFVHLRSLEADLNAANQESGDVVFGTYSSFGDTTGDIVPSSTGVANAVKIRLRQTNVRNGEVTFTLARLLGIDSKPMEVNSIASMARNIRGFSSPEGSAKVNLLPFAIKKELWESLVSGSDNYSYDFDSQTVSSGSDGVREINIYPHETGSSGNSGTVDLGASGNSTADVKRQIVEGISASDLAHHGGQIELNANGELMLNGDTGISAGMKSQLNSIVGEPKVIMIYSQVTGNGNNANFTIIKFVGVRVLHVNFQGSKNKSKKLIIQPADVVAEYVIISNEDNETSENVYSPAVIVH